VTKRSRPFSGLDYFLALLLAVTGQTKTPPIEQGRFDNAAQEIRQLKKSGSSRKQT
jgi:hypothetical protein